MTVHEQIPQRETQSMDSEHKEVKEADNNLAEMDGSRSSSESPRKEVVPKDGMDSKVTADERSASDGESRNEKDGEEEEDDDKYVTGIRLFALTISILSTVFIVALSNTIISTAIPTLTSVFNSYDDIAWYTSAEALTATAFQLPFGRAYALLNLKWTFLGSLVIYLLGSLICGVAPTSIALIIGRAIAGVGNAGVFSGVFILIARNVPLRKRALYAGMVGAFFAIAAVLGPILGGLFTTHVSWRWCFYINLPIGGVALLVILLFLPASLGKSDKGLKGLTWWQAFKKFNPFGATLILAAIICLLLALQWGGAKYPWSDGRVITVFVVFGVTLIAWIILQYYQGDEATVPFSVAKQRTVAGSALYSVCLSAAIATVIFFLPIWYQSVQGDSAATAGLKQLGIVVGLSVFAVVAGGAVVGIGYYNPILICGTILSSVGAGLLYTIDLSTHRWRILGYQFIFAAGVGMSLEQCNVAVQTVLPDNQIPQGTSLILFSRVLGTALAGPIAQSVLQQGLISHLGAQITAMVYGASGATDIRKNLEAIYGTTSPAFTKALNGVNDSVTKVFMVSLILAAITVLFIPLIEWKSVKKEKRANEDRKEGKGKKKSKKGKKDEEMGMEDKAEKMMEKSV